MRVLTITPPLPTAERPGTMPWVMRQVRAMRARGAEVKVLELRGPRAIKYLLSIPRFLRMARSADVIHAHYGYCGLLARLAPQKPIVVTFTGNDLLGLPDARGRPTRRGRFFVQLHRLLARVLDAVIVMSPEMARIVAPVAARVLPYGPDLELFAPLARHEARAALGWSADGLRVLFAGYPENPRKNYPLALAAIAEAERLLGLSLELVALRNVPPDRTPLFFNAVDAILFTSYWEGSPTVIKEAMACNRPIVSVPVGNTELLLAGVSQCAVCPRDVAALGRALAEVLRSGEPSDGREKLLRLGYDGEAIALQVLEVLESAVARSAGGARARAVAP